MRRVNDNQVVHIPSSVIWGELEPTRTEKLVPTQEKLEQWELSTPEMEKWLKAAEQGNKA